MESKIRNLKEEKQAPENPLNTYERKIKREAEQQEFSKEEEESSPMKEEEEEFEEELELESQPKKIKKDWVLLRNVQQFINMKIPDFDGITVSTSFRAWVRFVELFFSTLGISKENKVTVISLAFKVSAREWWNSAQTEIEDGIRENISTWEELKEVMSKKYAPQNEMHECYTQLWNLKQTKTLYKLQ